MKLLLDTHTFLWFINGSLNLNNYSRHLIEEQTNRRFLSVASLWEMSIKISIGKLTLPMSIPDLIVEQVYGNAIKLLSISPEHLEILRTLTFHHKDPFDRLIISQSIHENIPVLSRDTSFDSYSIKRLWSNEK